MTTTRIPAVELLSTARNFSPDENLALDALTDEQIVAAALADPDAQPATPEMLRRGQANRRHRLFSQRLATELMGATLTRAEPGLDLPVWEVTDYNGRTMLLKAADIRRVAADPGPAATVLRIEALTPNEPSRKEDRSEQDRSEQDNEYASDGISRQRAERQDV